MDIRRNCPIARPAKNKNIGKSGQKTSVKLYLKLPVKSRVYLRLKGCGFKPQSPTQPLRKQSGYGWIRSSLPRCDMH